MQRMTGILIVVVVGLALGALVTAAVEKVSGLIGLAKETEMHPKGIEYLK